MASPASGSPQVSQDSASQGSALSPPPRQPPLSFSPGGNWLPKQGGPGEEEAGTTPGGWHHARSRMAPPQLWRLSSRCSRADMRKILDHSEARRLAFPPFLVESATWMVKRKKWGASPITWGKPRNHTHCCHSREQLTLWPLLGASSLCRG